MLSTIIILLGSVPLCKSLNELDQIAGRRHLSDEDWQGRKMSPKCKDKVLTPHFLFSDKIKSYTRGNPNNYKMRGLGKVLVNTHEKTFARKDKYSVCKFTPIREKGPVPVLFIAEGRSGSSNTWMTLSTLAGEQNEALETVGSTSDQLKEFFNEYLQSEEEASWWVTEHMCEITKYNCNSAIAGFQWKPYSDSISSPNGKAALKKIGSYEIDDSGEKIRVLYMTRNPIDVMVSKKKHGQSGVSAHCSPNDKKCLKAHKKSEKSIYLPTKKLIKKLKEVQLAVKTIEDTLDEMGINYYKTTYEKLYNRDDPEEWMNIFRYLGAGPSEGLTLNDITNAFPYAKTSKPSRKDAISNYNEIKVLLEGTDLEYFLEE